MRFKVNKKHSPPLVVGEADITQAKELHEDLTKAVRALHDRCSPALPEPERADHQAVFRLERLQAALELALLEAVGAMATQGASGEEPPTRREGIGSDPPAKKEAVPQEHVEHVVKVHRAAADGRHTGVAITRTFGAKRAAAEDFYARTINVHQAKANSDEAPAYDVELATQDDRDWRKDRQYTVQKHQLVVGRAHQCKPTG